MLNYKIKSLLVKLHVEMREHLKTFESKEDRDAARAEWHRECAVLGGLENEHLVRLADWVNKADETMAAVKDTLKSRQIVKYNGEFAFAKSVPEGIEIWTDDSVTLLTTDDVVKSKSFIDGLEIIGSEFRTNDSPSMGELNLYGGYATMLNGDTMECTIDIETGYSKIRVNNEFCQYGKPVAVDGFTHGYGAAIAYAASQIIHMTTQILGDKDRLFKKRIYPILVGCIAETCGFKVYHEEEYDHGGNFSHHYVEVRLPSGHTYTVDGLDVTVDKEEQFGDEVECILDSVNLTPIEYAYIKHATRTITGKRPKTEQVPANLDRKMVKSMKAAFKPLRGVLQ